MHANRSKTVSLIDTVASEYTDAISLDARRLSAMRSPLKWQAKAARRRRAQRKEEGAPISAGVLLNAR
jgi:hypothetical protein